MIRLPVRATRAGRCLVPGVDVRVYIIRLFEIADALRESYFGETDMENTRSIMVLGDEALFAKLGELNISVDILDSPHRVDYPR